MIETFTIGFTKKSAEQFFTKLQNAGVKRLLDVRLNNSSQLAGFAKRDDLQFFLKALGGIEYEYVAELAPTKDILDTYKKHGGDWIVYDASFWSSWRSVRSKRSSQNQCSMAVAYFAVNICQTFVIAVWLSSI